MGGKPSKKIKAGSPVKLEALPPRSQLAHKTSRGNVKHSTNDPIEKLRRPKPVPRTPKGTAVALKPLSKFENFPNPKSIAGAPDGWQLEDVEKDGGSSRNVKKVEKSSNDRTPKTKVPRNPRHSRVQDVNVVSSKTSSFHDTKNLKELARLNKRSKVSSFRGPELSQIPGYSSKQHSAGHGAAHTLSRLAAGEAKADAKSPDEKRRPSVAETIEEDARLATPKNHVKPHLTVSAGAPINTPKSIASTPSALAAGSKSANPRSPTGGRGPQISDAYNNKTPQAKNTVRIGNTVTFGRNESEAKRHIEAKAGGSPVKRKTKSPSRFKKMNLQLQLDVDDAPAGGALTPVGRQHTPARAVGAKPGLSLNMNMNMNISMNMGAANADMVDDLEATVQASYNPQRSESKQHTPGMQGQGSRQHKREAALPGPDAAKKNQFMFVEHLGQGTSGMVHKSLHLPSMQLVAVKVIQVYDQAKKQQMMRELQVLAKNKAEYLTNPAAPGGGGSGGGSGSGGRPRSREWHRPSSKEGFRESWQGRPSSKGSDGGYRPSSKEGVRGGGGGRDNSKYIVALYETYMYDDRGFLVMEYMDGGSLQDIADGGGCASERVLASIAQQVLRGLLILYQNNQVHRDVKPANLLINHKGEVKLADFGVTREIKTEGAAKTFIGTVSYMSPERITAGKYSYSSDIWSLGLSLMTVAMGVFPYKKDLSSYFDLLDTIVQEPVPVLEPRDSVDGGDGGAPWSSEFQDFISCAMLKDPHKRATAQDLLDHPFITHNCTPLIESVEFGTGAGVGSSSSISSNNSCSSSSSSSSISNSSSSGSASNGSNGSSSSNSNSNRGEIAQTLWGDDVEHEELDLIMKQMLAYLKKEKEEHGSYRRVLQLWQGPLKLFHIVSLAAQLGLSEQVVMDTCIEKLPPELTCALLAHSRDF